MTRWYLYLICSALVFAGLAGCSDEAPQPPQPQQSTSVKTPAAQAPAPVAEAEVKAEAEFVYVTEGRRDPFVPLSVIRRPLVTSDQPATPLQSYDLNQFRLVGVIVGKGESKAMVVAPDGKSYILSKGVGIGKNNGIIVKITSEVILVEEKYYDFSGNVIQNIQEISVPKREGV